MEPADPVNEACEPSALPLTMVADLQEHLVAACDDLDRLQGLLADACGTLMTSFQAAVGRLDGDVALRVGDASVDAALDSIRRHLGSAVVALQFHDLGTQLLSHTRRRLRGCADRLGCDALAGDDDGEGAVEELPQLPNPVTQAALDAGSIELFS